MKRTTFLLSAISLVIAACGGNTTVDGSGGGSAGGNGSGASNAGGNGGAGGQACAALEAAYAEALEGALACNSAIDVPQCTQLVFTDLPCPCQEVFVNAENEDAIQQLASLRDQYLAQGCGPDGCPAIACVPPTSGSCVATGTGSDAGLCESE
jgi:hypothetical protein